MKLVLLSLNAKGNIVPIRKKGDKQTLKNYRLESLLPIYREILERLMFNEMFKFFIKNKLISSSQSVIFNVSKAFDKVWHDGIIFKLTQNGISGNLLNLCVTF